MVKKVKDFYVPSTVSFIPLEEDKKEGRFIFRTSIVLEKACQFLAEHNHLKSASLAAELLIKKALEQIAKEENRVFMLLRVQLHSSYFKPLVKKAKELEWNNKQVKELENLANSDELREYQGFLTYQTLPPELKFDPWFFSKLKKNLLSIPEKQREEVIDYIRRVQSHLPPPSERLALSTVLFLKSLGIHPYAIPPGIHVVNVFLHALTFVISDVDIERAFEDLFEFEYIVDSVFQGKGMLTSILGKDKPLELLEKFLVDFFLKKIKKRKKEGSHAKEN